MRNIFSIAKNTFFESIRDRILYGILAFSIIFIFGTVLLGSLSLGEDLKIIKDFGLAGIYIFSIITTIFLGTSMIYKEIEKKTIYILFSKPVTLSEIIIGKFFGLFAAVTLNTILMSIPYFIIIATKGGGFDYYSLVAILVQFQEISIFISLSILFSTFSTPLAGALYATLVLIIGHSLKTLALYAIKLGAVAKFFSALIYYLLPNLEKFNLRNLAAHNSTLSLPEILLTTLYAIAYVSVVLLIASISLKKQEL